MTNPSPLLFAIALLFSRADVLQGSKLVPVEQFQRDQMASLQRIRDRVAREKKEAVWKVQPSDIQADREFKAMMLDERTQPQLIQAALTTDLAELPPVVNLAGYLPLSFTAANPALDYTVRKAQTSPSDPPGFTSVKNMFGGGAIVQVVHLKITSTHPSQPGTPPAPPFLLDQWIGPVLRTTLNAQIDQVKKQNATTKIEVLGQSPMTLYSDAKGHLVWVVDAGVVPNPSLIRQGMDMSYYKIPSSELTPAPGAPAPLTPTYLMSIAVRFGK